MRGQTVEACCRVASVGYPSTVRRAFDLMSGRLKERGIREKTFITEEALTLCIANVFLFSFVGDDRRHFVLGVVFQLFKEWQNQDTRSQFSTTKISRSRIQDQDSSILIKTRVDFNASQRAGEP